MCLGATTTGVYQPARATVALAGVQINFFSYWLLQAQFKSVVLKEAAALISSYGVVPFYEKIRPEKSHQNSAVPA
jgi:hypothetical protein